MAVERGACVFDPWLAEVFGHAVYRLDAKRPDAWATFEKTLMDAGPAPLFLYAKVEIGDLEAVHRLERRGFALVETNVTFEKTRDEAPTTVERSIVRRATPADRDAVVEIARTGFRYTRFHVDPRIPKALADRLKGEWAGNFFSGRRGDHMVVAEVEGALAGFTLLLAGADASLTIDLIAVDPRHRRRGIARAMLDCVEREFPTYRTLRAGTQLANAPSLVLYQSLGYRVARAHYVFHFHRGPSPREDAG